MPFTGILGSVNSQLGNLELGQSVQNASVYLGNGTITFSGIAASVSISISTTPVGNVSLSGLSFVQIAENVATSGTILFTGLSKVVVNASIPAVGRILFTGLFNARTNIAFSGVGGIAFSGIGAVVVAYTPIAVGGLSCSGLAGVKESDIYNVTGQISLNGSADVRLSANYACTGNLCITGSEDTKIVKFYPTKFKARSIAFIRSQATKGILESVCIKSVTAVNPSLVFGQVIPLYTDTYNSLWRENMLISQREAVNLATIFYTNRLNSANAQLKKENSCFMP